MCLRMPPTHADIPIKRAVRSLSFIGFKKPDYNHKNQADSADFLPVLVQCQFMCHVGSFSFGASPHPIAGLGDQ